MTSIARQPTGVTASASTQRQRSTPPPTSTSPSNSSSNPDSSSTAAFTSSPTQSHSSLPSPASPTSTPSSSILINRTEQPKLSSHCKNVEGGFKQTLKAAFLHPPAPGKLAKTDGKPLGKSFIRQTPINVKEKIQGGEILDWDPRGRDASVGDGVRPPEFQPNGGFVGGGGDDEEAVIEDEVDLKGNEKENQEINPTSSIADQRKSSITSESTDSSSSIIPDDSTSNRERHSSIASSTNTYTSSQNGSGSSKSNTSSSIHAIKFAPLPTSGRLKRANSITIGVAARSQLLHSQGTGRSWQSQQRQQSHPMQPFSPSSLHTPVPQKTNKASSNSSSASIPSNTSPKDKKPFINTEEELKKGASNLWRRMRSTSSSSSKSSNSNSTPDSSYDSTPSVSANSSSTDTTSTSFTTQDEEPTSGTGGIHSIPDESGHATPKRPSSPHHHPQDHHHHQQHPSHLSHHVSHLDETEEGSRTPKTQPHHPPLTRRVSTGAYLRDQSIRGMQDERRKEFIGDVDEFRKLDPNNHRHQEGFVGFESHGVEGDEAAMTEEEAGGKGKGLIANWMASLAGTGSTNQTEEEKTRSDSNPSSNSKLPNGKDHNVAVIDPPSPNESNEEFHEIPEEVGNPAEQEDEDEEAAGNGDGSLDEEEIEAEKLAEEAFKHNKVKGVGKEKVSGRAT